MEKTISFSSSVPTQLAWLPLSPPNRMSISHSLTLRHRVAFCFSVAMGTLVLGSRRLSMSHHSFWRRVRRTLTVIRMPHSFSTNLHGKAVTQVSRTFLARLYGGHHPLPNMRHHLCPRTCRGYTRFWKVEAQGVSHGRLFSPETYPPRALSRTSG